MYIGEQIKKLRISKGIKLQELAKKSGVQIATLSRIEHMKMVGSLESHMRIAKALGVDITQLYSNIIPQETLNDLKAAKDQPANVFSYSDKSSYELLTTRIIGKKMMPILLKIEAGGQTNPEQGPFGAEKFIFVLDGKVDVRLGGEVFSLGKSNTLYFDASKEHKFVNTGKTTARVICIGTPVML